MKQLKKVFYKTKKAVSNRLLPVDYKTEKFIDGGYVYLYNSVWIGKLSDQVAKTEGGKYYLAIENSEWINDNLEDLENILLENWCKHEFLQNPYDYKETENA